MRVPSIAALAFIAALSPAGAATLTFAPAPEITFEIPAGWSACDAVTRAALQGPPPRGQLKDLCKGFDDKGGERAAGTPDGSVMMSFILTKPDEFPPDFFKGATSKTISDLSAGLCKTVFDALPSGVPCVFALSNVANRKAIVGRIHPANGRFDFSRMVIVPGNQRSAAFVLMARSPTADTDAGMDAIVASIRVSAKAKGR